jgi:hypothetical protein
MQHPPHHAQATSPATVAEDSGRMPSSALLLGLLGVVPFAALALVAFLRLEERAGLPPGLARAGLVGYGVVIASFLGGIRWGVGLNHPVAEHRTSLFVMSVLAPIVAWGALFMPHPHDLVVLIGCFLVLGVSDVALSMRGTAPRWYGKLRTMLTALVVGILILALALLPFEA